MRPALSLYAACRHLVQSACHARVCTSSFGQALCTAGFRRVIHLMSASSPGNRTSCCCRFWLTITVIIASVQQASSSSTLQDVAYRLQDVAVTFVPRPCVSIHRCSRCAFRSCAPVAACRMHDCVGSGLAMRHASKKCKHPDSVLHLPFGQQSITVII